MLDGKETRGCFHNGLSVLIHSGQGGKYYPQCLIYTSNVLHLIFATEGGSGKLLLQATRAVHGRAKLYSSVKPFNGYHLESWMGMERGSMLV